MIGLEYICKFYDVEFKKVAEDLNITPQTINSWLRGKRKLPDSRAKEIANLPYFKGINPELFQNKITEEDKAKIDFECTLHKHNTIIEAIEEKMIFNQHTSTDISNLIISLFWKMMLEGIDNPKLGLKVHTLKRVLDLLIAEHDEDIVDILWETVDNIAGAEDTYIDQLGALNMKYLD